MRELLVTTTVQLDTRAANAAARDEVNLMSAMLARSRSAIGPRCHTSWQSENDEPPYLDAKRRTTMEGRQSAEVEWYTKLTK